MLPHHTPLAATGAGAGAAAGVGARAAAGHCPRPLHPGHTPPHSHPRAACAADRPDAVTLLLAALARLTRSADCALDALIAAAGAGSEAALGAVLASPQLRDHMDW